jgi:alpha-beta hydrolase superfamily lysophospholipase
MHLLGCTAWTAKALAQLDDMNSLTVIAKQHHPGQPYILLGHGMGSFPAQQFIPDHSDSIDGLALSGSGALVASFA